MKAKQDKEAAASISIKKLKQFDPDEISWQEAAREFGEAQITSWQNKKYISKMNAGKGRSPIITYSRAELLLIKRLTEEGKLR